MDLLEQAAEATQLADRRGVGARHDGPVEGPRPDQLGDADAGARGDPAELLLLSRRDADVEALREGGRSLTSERHRPGLRSAGCEKRKRRAPPRLAEPRLREAERRAGGAQRGLGGHVRRQPHVSGQAPILLSDSDAW